MGTGFPMESWLVVVVVGEICQKSYEKQKMVMVGQTLLGGDFPKFRVLGIPQIPRHHGKLWGIQTGLKQMD